MKIKGKVNAKGIKNKADKSFIVQRLIYIYKTHYHQRHGPQWHPYAGNENELKMH